MGRLSWAGAMGRKTEARIQQRKNLNAVMLGLPARNIDELGAKSKFTPGGG